MDNADSDGPPTIADRRGDSPCLTPVLLDHVVDDPEAVRELARRNGPYTFPDRPGGFIWPTWHTKWAVNGEVLVDAAAPLMQHRHLADAAAKMCGTRDIVPDSLNVNLGTPWIAQPVMHTDMPEFRGVDATNAPGWFLQAMGTSRLFEAERVNAITAVCWFYEGANGGFSYWPEGRGGPTITQAETWNTAIVGDNDFMYHKVERIGPDGSTSPNGMTASSTLDHDGDSWVVANDDDVLGRYDNEQIRLSLSWTAKVHDGRDDTTSLDVVFDQMAEALGNDMIATSPTELFGEPSRVQLMAKWPGFVPG